MDSKKENIVDGRSIEMPLTKIGLLKWHKFPEEKPEADRRCYVIHSGIETDLAYFVVVPKGRHHKEGEYWIESGNMNQDGGFGGDMKNVDAWIYEEDIPKPTWVQPPLSNVK